MKTHLLASALCLLALSACDQGVQPAAEVAALTADKVTLCHVTGNPDQTVQIVVADAAVAAHLAHGDHLPNAAGTCTLDPCATLPDGTMFCEGTGFITCDGGQPVYRDCAPGTACRAVDQSVVCDWPQ